MCLDAKQYDPADPKKPLYLCDFSKGEHAQVAGKKMQ